MCDALLLNSRAIWLGGVGKPTLALPCAHTRHVSTYVYTHMYVHHTPTSLHRHATQETHNRPCAAVLVAKLSLQHTAALARPHKYALLGGGMQFAPVPLSHILSLVFSVLKKKTESSRACLSVFSSSSLCVCGWVGVAAGVRTIVRRSASSSTHHTCNN